MKTAAFSAFVMLFAAVLAAPVRFFQPLPADCSDVIRRYLWLATWMLPAVTPADR
jgi:hypothetical protein